MKKVALFFFLALFQINAHAESTDADIAKQVFMDDAQVTAAILSAHEQNYRVDDQIGVLHLKGSCGFAGCFDSYVLSVGIHQNRVINPQSKSVIAKITLMNSQPYKVELLDSSSL